MQEARLLAGAVLVLGCGRTHVGLVDADPGRTPEVSATGGVAGSGHAGAGGMPTPPGGAGVGGSVAGCTARIGAPSPADGAQDVSTSTDVAVQVECAEGVEPNWGALMLSVSARERDVAGRIERDSRLKRVRFLPDRPLALAATFDAKLFDASSGVVLFTWRFTTRDGAWRESAVITGTDLALTVERNRPRRTEGGLGG